MSTKYNAVCVFTTGAPGSGKTYDRCARFLWDWWMPQEKGVHWSNFPVNIERFTNRFPDAEDRIKLIPEEELRAWAECPERGPWDFFKEKDIANAHISIDEAHNFVRRNGKGATESARRWSLWLGEIRHRGCTVEFLSQDPHKLNKCIEDHSAVRILLVNSEDRRDPLFNVLMCDWYELRAALTGVFETRIWKTEERRINGKWVKQGAETFALVPDYFVLYDSYNTPHSGGVKAEGKQREYQKRGKLGLLAWFARRNWFNFTWRFLAVAAVCWFLLGGGIPFAIAQFNQWVQSRAEAKNAERAEKKTKAAEAKAAERVGKLAPPKSARQSRAAEAPAAPSQDEVAAPKVSKSVPVVMRSETVRHAPLEQTPASAAQQKAVPRLTYLGQQMISLDDGRICRAGDQVGEMKLLAIKWNDRGCEFESVNGVRVFVPVGGPVGVPGQEAKAVERVQPGEVQKSVPASSARPTDDKPFSGSGKR